MSSVETEPGQSEIQLAVDHRHQSPAQRVHGGVYFTMMDTAMGRAIVSRLPEGQGCATIEAKINFFRPTQTGSLRAKGKCINLSRRTAYAEAELYDDEGRLVAKATSTFMLTETFIQSDRERV